MMKSRLSILELTRISVPLSEMKVVMIHVAPVLFKNVLFTLTILVHMMTVSNIVTELFVSKGEDRKSNHTTELPK